MGHTGLALGAGEAGGAHTGAVDAGIAPIGRGYASEGARAQSQARGDDAAAACARGVEAWTEPANSPW